MLRCCFLRKEKKLHNNKEHVNLWFGSHGNNRRYGKKLIFPNGGCLLENWINKTSRQDAKYAKIAKEE